MKRGAKFFLKGEEGDACGPFRWTVVRQWVAVGSLRAEDEVRLADETTWQPIGAIPELMAPPPADEKNEGLTHVRTRAQVQKPVGPRAGAYLKALGCPVPLVRLNPYTAFQWVRLLEEINPPRTNPIEHWAAEEESQDRVPSATPEDATPAQLEALRARGHPIPAQLSRREAQRLISGPPSPGQLRRLKFYGLTLPAGAGRDEAADLIDQYMREHWETEEAYQAAKSRLAAEAAAPDAGANPASAPAPGAGRTAAEDWPRTSAPKLTLKVNPALPPPSPPRVSAPPVPPRRAPATLRFITVSGVLAVGALAVTWAVVKRNRGTPTAGAASSPPSLMHDEGPRPGAAALSPAEAAGQEFQAYVMTLKLTGIFGGSEPRASIDGLMYRVGDVVDRPRGVVIVHIDTEKPSVVFGDAKRNLFERVLK